MSSITKRIASLMLVLCCIWSGATFATGNQYSLLFKSGIIQPEENLEGFILSPLPPAGEIFNGVYFRMIQFNEIPSNDAKAALQQSGFRLTGYFPKNAYWVAISVNADKRELRKYNVRSVYQPSDQQKMNADLFFGNYPVHAMDGPDRIRLNVRCFKGLDQNLVESYLLSHNISIERRYDYASWMDINVPVNRIHEIANYPFVVGLGVVSPPDEPDDQRGRSLHRSSNINRMDAPIGRHYSGAGVSAALADDGPVGPHIDYTGRIDQSNTTVNVGNHGDMTVGILMGAGNLNPVMAGMGTGAYIYVYDIGGYNHILNSPVTNVSQGVMVTSTSYSQGCNDYTNDTQTGDQILNQNPTLLHVYSAGNNNGNNCGYGAGGNWGNITGGYKQGKNVIACGNLDAYDIIDNTSSRGPASDGRIKPDICSNGRNQMSTDGPNSYQTGGGTSAACPGIAGIVTQLHQAYRDLNGGATAEGGLIKACLQNTAEDIGNPGPDFVFGYGRVNAYRAVTTLEDGRYFIGTLSQGGAATHNITVPANTQQLRVMVYWADFEGDPAALTALVNDINMVVTDPNATTFDPWVLDPTPVAANLSAPAVRGVDNLNNMEQVTIDNPVAGIYTVDLDGFSIPQGPETYFLVYEFRTDEIAVSYPIGYEGFVPGESEAIRWDAVGNTTQFTIEYSTDNGSNWNTISSTVNPSSRYFNWTVPATVTGEALIRVTRNGVSGESDDTFSIIGLPTGITVDWACPDSIQLSWNAVTGASGYEVSVLGSMYMDSIAYSATNTAVVYGLNPLVDQWFSVKAYTNLNTKGRRANAIFKSPGTFGCAIALDAAINNIITPSTSLKSCNDLTAIPVEIELFNSGISVLSNIPVSYSLDGNTPVTEIFAGPLASSATTNYTFTATVDLSAPGTHDLIIWADLTGDGNHYNDSVTVSINTLNSVAVTLPYAEDFESFSLCSTATNCGATVCPTANGWENVANGNGDDIDWRVNEGGTVSTGTGPTIDHNPGTATGNYIYTEASACFNQRAEIITPCIDLTTAVSPVMEFWYHMLGTTMGTLHIDVFSNNVWQLDVIPAISGNFGTSWQQQMVGLGAFAGDIINIRFRGITGPDFMSDLAIDDINIYESSAPPVAGFIVAPQVACPGQITQLTDLSLNNPTAWSWTIAPSGFTYVNGTDSSSQNPQVIFGTVGTYDITLNVTNGFGTNSTTQLGALAVSNGTMTPLVEPFQSGVFPPVYWNILNPDGSITWQEATITGASGTSTEAAFVNNFGYNAAGQRDYLETELIDLTGNISPQVTFDVAAATFNAGFADSLMAEISTDCGDTYVPTGYVKGGPDLATVFNIGVSFQPSSAAQWRSDTIDLTAYTNNIVKLRFVNITDYGNNTYIDNINFRDASLGIDDPAGWNNGISVYPNPASNLVTVTRIASGDEVFSVTVNDIKGAAVMVKEFHSKSGTNQFTIDISALESGIYFLNMRAGDSQCNQKLVKL